MTDFIWTERPIYSDSDMLVQREVLHGTPPDNFKNYRAILQRPTGLSDPQGNTLMAQGVLDFDAESPLDAFAKLPTMKAEFESAAKKQAAHAILTQPPPKGFDPNKTPPNGFRPRLAG